MFKIDLRLHDLNKESDESRKIDNMFNRIMSENIPGVLGRLGDLATISSVYDEVLTSAMGGRLDNIVVKTIEAGTAVI